LLAGEGHLLVMNPDVMPEGAGQLGSSLLDQVAEGHQTSLLLSASMRSPRDHIRGSVCRRH
jgi:hypothetical protein